MKEKIPHQKSRNDAGQIGNQSGCNSVAGVSDSNRTEIHSNDIKRGVGGTVFRIFHYASQ